MWMVIVDYFWFTIEVKKEHIWTRSCLGVFESVVESRERERERERERVRERDGRLHRLSQRR